MVPGVEEDDGLPFEDEDHRIEQLIDLREVCELLFEILENVDKQADGTYRKSRGAELGAAASAALRLAGRRTPGPSPTATRQPGRR